MKVAVIGAGPAGLYFSYLLKTRRPEADIRVFEQNPPGATFGFGVVFSDRALEFLREDDSDTYDLITPRMESWSNITLDLDSTVIRIDGIGFSAIGRLELLRLLGKRVESVGIQVEYEHAIKSLDELAGVDLIVAADGVNSLVRQGQMPTFGTRVTYLSNKFIWYGTPRIFETLTQSFRRNEHGVFNVHHYRYKPDMSTFLVETDAFTWQRAGFAAMNHEDTKLYCERLFADVLDESELVSNKSVWRNFPLVKNSHWHTGNMVLMGDSLHTAHYSIGSGTRLAMEDSIALVRAITQHPNRLTVALTSYEVARRPIVEKFVAAANRSANWYEDFGEHMKLRPMDFAMSYITRSGRIDLDRLRKHSPQFMAAYDGMK